MISRPGSLAGLLVLFIACGEPSTSSTAEPFTVTDSAGVEVVTNSPANVVLRQ
jgi:ABC-type Fe3+-citrate transport system substrate-binding protein